MESNKHITISSVLYYFWQLSYKNGSTFRANRIMSNHFVHAREFCTGLREKRLELIDNPKYVYMLGIPMLLDGTRISVKFMEAT